MTDARLFPCSSCARHVRATEATCPFCSAALPAMRAAQALPLPRSTGTRLSRAALFALGASAAAAAACGTNDVPMYGAPGVAQDGGSERTPTPPYGAPPVDGGDGNDAGDPEDAGSDAADGGVDAGDDAADAEGGPSAPPYGAPPP